MKKIMLSAFPFSFTIGGDTGVGAIAIDTAGFKAGLRTGSARSALAM